MDTIAYTHTHIVATTYVTNRTCVVVSPGSVTTPHTTMELLMKSKSLQLIPSLQLYLYNACSYMSKKQHLYVATYYKCSGY